MVAELKPLTEFQTAADMQGLAIQVNRLISQQHLSEFLKQRHMIGVLQRHSGSVPQSYDNLSRTRDNQAAGKINACAILGENGKVRGMATMYPGLPLRLQTVSWPPRFAVRRLSRTIPIAGPEISAWTNETSPPQGTMDISTFSALDTLLYETYNKMVSVYNVDAMDEGSEHSDKNAWTIEPRKVPDWVHTAIQESGLRPRANGYFNDDESNAHFVPLSTLYSADPVAKLDSIHPHGIY